MSHWSDIYQADVDKKGGNVPYVKGKVIKKKKLVDLIKKYARENKKVIECGCGTAVVGMNIALDGYSVLGVDNDEDVLALARKLNNDYFKSEGKNGDFTLKNETIFDLQHEDQEFDVAFNNGVLEHFSDDEIIKIIKEQLRVSKVAILGIPTKYFEKKEAKYGNERVLELKYWRQLIRNAGGDIIEEAGMHREPFKKRIVNFKKYFKPRPYHLFVVRKSI